MSYYAVVQKEQFNPDEFVRQWSSLYQYDLEGLYETNITRPLTPEKIEQLYEWKNGMTIAEKKMQSVRQFIKSLGVLNRPDFNPTAGEFLNERFREGGAIWRIFFLHCWKPDTYPIYDQHVYRAMCFIEQDEIREIPNNDNEKINIYLNQYCDFIQTKFANYQPENTLSRVRLKEIDKSLVTFGRFLKSFKVI